MGAKKFFGQLWVQLALLLGATGFITGLLTVVLFVGAFSRFALELPPDARAAVEQKIQERTGHAPNQTVPFLGVFRWAGFSALLLGSLIVVTVATFVARQVLRPLETLAASTRRLAGGDLAVRSPNTGSGELFDLIGDFNAVAERLERADAARKFTTASVAHELRTPIAALRARLDGIQDGIFPPDKAELGKLDHQLELLSRLATDLQIISLADAGGLGLQTRWLDLALLLRDVAEDHRLLFEKANIELKLEAPPTLPIQGDPERLRQVIHNLLDNAARYVPTRGAVWLRLALQENQALLYISDNGPGVPQEELELLFDRFYRADTSRSRSSGGSGLGLAIVRALVEAHGGNAEAKKAAEGGLEVVLKIPLSPKRDEGLI